MMMQIWTMSLHMEIPWQQEQARQDQQHSQDASPNTVQPEAPLGGPSISLATCHKSPTVPAADQSKLCVRLKPTRQTCVHVEQQHGDCLSVCKHILQICLVLTELNITNAKQDQTTVLKVQYPNETGQRTLLLCHAKQSMVLTTMVLMLVTIRVLVSLNCPQTKTA